MEGAFFCSDLPDCSDKQISFFKDAHEHGVGQTGFSVPLTDRANRKALFSVISNLARPDWKAKIGQDRDLLLKIGDLLHIVALSRSFTAPMKVPPWRQGRLNASTGPRVAKTRHPSPRYCISANIRCGTISNPLPTSLVALRARVPFMK
jgi:hypothetical protein